MPNAALRAVAMVIVLASSGAAVAQDSANQAPADAAAFRDWIDADPRRAPQVAALEAFLSREGVKEVVPTWQLIRTATSWRRCGAPFAVPEASLWPNIVPALRFVRDRIKPVVGDVEPVAVYRDEAMNSCAGGARASAHRTFHALDLVPVRPLSLNDLTAALCPIHAAHGPRGRIGLGFYVGRRFHIDARGFRTWGPDHRAASSPCRA